MKLSTAHTREFLTSWAQQAGFLCDGLDSLLGELNSRAISLSAPLTLEACLALTDEELQKYYAEFGLAKFYPDLSHEAKALFLWKQAMEWRWLGTPKAVEDLCQYVFDQTPVELHINDQLAWDSTGALVNPALLNVFDVELSVQAADLPENALHRIFANIVRFKNARTSLRGFSFLFDMFFDSTTCVRDGGQYERFYDVSGFTRQPQPTVTMKRGYFNYGRSSVTIGASSSKPLYDTYYDGSSHSASYDSSKTYTVCRTYYSAGDSTGSIPKNLTILNSGGTIALKNWNDSYISLQRFDFVDSIPPVLLKTAYFRADKAPYSPVGIVTDLRLYDATGTQIVIPSGKKVYPRQVLTGSNSQKDPWYNIFTNFYRDSSGYLAVDFGGSLDSFVSVTYFII